MSNLFKLIKVLFRMDNTLLVGKAKEKNKLSVVIAVFVCVLIEGVIVKFMLDAYAMLAKNNFENILAAASLSVSTLFTILFSFFYIMDTFYFSRDIEILMTFPLKSYQILGAKTAIVFIHQYFLQIFVLLPTLITFNYKVHSFIFFVYSIIIYFIFPIIPIAVCSILSIVIMSFRVVIKNKVIFNVFCVSFISALILIMYLLNASMNSNDLYLIDNITSYRYKVLMDNITSIFLNARLAVHSLIDYKSINGFFYLITLIFVSIAMIFLMMLIAKRVYLKSIIGINESSFNRKRSIKSISFKRRTAFTAYIVKELKEILRTPAYFQNCILSGVVIPCIIFIIICKIVLRNYVISNNIFLVVGTSIIIFISQLNEVCCTSISREGNLFFIVNYIPIKFKTQILAKAVSGMIVSFISEVLILVSSIFIFKISIYIVLLSLIVSILGNVGFSLLGILIDLKFPKLQWENEVAVVKNNFNSSIHEILTLIIITLIAAIVMLFQESLEVTFSLLVFTYILIAIYIYKLLLKKGEEILKNGFYFNKIYVNKVEKITSKLKGVFVLVIVFAAVLMVFISAGTKTSIKITRTNFQIKGGFISKNYSIKKITKIYLKDTVPETRKVMGDNIFGVKRGEFYVDGFGKGMLFLEKDKGPFIYVIMNKDFVIINNKNVSETKKIYNELIKQKFNK